MLTTFSFDLADLQINETNILTKSQDDNINKEDNVACLMDREI